MAQNVSKNAQYLDSLSSSQKEEILKAVATHYRVFVSEMEDELIDCDAESLYEYLAFDKVMAMQVYQDMTK